jgi:hypothetical protein
MCHNGPHVRAPDLHTPVLPWGSALIPNVTPWSPCGWTCYPWWVARPVTPSNSLGYLDWPNRPTLVFSVHFVLTRVYPGKTFRSVTHPQIALGQARLTQSSGKEGIPCQYEYPINPIKPWARISYVFTFNYYIEIFILNFYFWWLKN